MVVTDDSGQRTEWELKQNIVDICSHCRRLNKSVNYR